MRRFSSIGMHGADVGMLGRGRGCGLPPVVNPHSVGSGRTLGVWRYVWMDGDGSSSSAKVAVGGNERTHRPAKRSRVDGVQAPRLSETHE